MKHLIFLLFLLSISSFVFGLLGMSNSLPYTEVRIVKGWNDGYGMDWFYLQKKCLVWFTVEDGFWFTKDNWVKHYNCPVITQRKPFSPRSTEDSLPLK